MSTNVEWAQAVVKHLLATDKKLFLAAIAASEDEQGELCPDHDRDPEGFLSWLRGDEPWDAKDMGDVPQDYAKFLLDEWKLFGPLGE